MNVNQVYGGSNSSKPLIFGIIFFISYWLLGYDGITFSDEVTYLSMGYHWWNNDPVISEYHFSSRWGAYLFSGFFTHLLGYHDRYASIASLLFYVLSLLVLWKESPTAQNKKWVVLFFISHTYLLHFLPKVYPDSLLVLWVILIPVSAVYRDKLPSFAAMVMAMAFLVGFCTKETMVLLFPFPLILFLFDLKRKKPLNFYYYFGLFSMLLVILYLSYYFFQFGDVFYRFKSVNEGHYISEYTYYDKGWLSILKRITYLPLLTFIERTYWIWMVLALPGIIDGFKNKSKPHLEFGLCSLCLLIGFWFMTSTLEFYNPIYLNPRHLIILLGPLSFSIALGAKYWLHDPFYKKILASLLTAGGFYSSIFADWKVGLFYFVFAAIILIKTGKFKYWMMAMALILPVIFAVYYQYQLKNYPRFLKAFQSTVLKSSADSPVLTHEFIVHSKEILLNQPDVQGSIFSIYNLGSLTKEPPERLTLFVYQYYQHAYVEEQKYLDKAEDWIKKEGYRLISSSKDQWLRIEVYKK